uniref:B12-binding domain-containing radical SAM protein n=1 Tax=Ignisphaera aggregans TaxID=334771 RepID=A0A7C4BBH3_9CREN
MKVILTAPADEMSEYNGNPAIAFVAGFSKPSFIPMMYIKRFLYRDPVYKDMGGLPAPLGLRRIEASLIESGIFRAEEIAVVHPDDIEDFVGRDTKIVGVSVKDPLGLGYVSLTYSTLLGFGEPITKLEFINLMKKLMELKRRYKFRVVIGGAGVWQLTMYGSIDDFGIDVVIENEGELVAPKVFADLALGAQTKRVIDGGVVSVEKIPNIRGPTVYGAIEITRGCGRGCMFCTPTMRLKRDIPLEAILKDTETNLKHGKNRALLVTEDLFLYGAKAPWEPYGDAITRLIDSITQLKNRGLQAIQVTHVNLAAVHYRKDVFKIISEKLYEFAWFKLKGRYINTVEVGIESGSHRIIGKLMRGKVLPYSPEEWFNVVLEALTYLEENNWVPLATIIVGLPGEEVDDAYKTLNLIDEINRHGLKTFLVPLLFVPLGGSALEDQPIKSFNELNEVQLDIFAECWKHNVRVWGEDHFKNYSWVQKKMLGLLAGIYVKTKAKEYSWRRKIAIEVYKELKGLLSNGKADGTQRFE